MLAAWLSRRFCLGQFVQRDEPDTVVLDIDVLDSVAAAFVGCADVNGFHQFMQHGTIQLFDIDVGFNRLNELLYSFILLFLYFDFLSQTDRIFLKLLLLGFLVLAEQFVLAVA